MTVLNKYSTKTSDLVQMLFRTAESGLVSSEAQLIIAYRSARSLVILVNTQDLLTADELLKKFPSLLNNLDIENKNAYQSIQYLLDEGEMLCLEVLDQKLYPEILINPNIDCIHTELPEVIKEARRQGYADWEILKFLVTENTVQTGLPDAGKPLEYDSIEELCDEINVENRIKVKAKLATPIDALTSGEIELFNQYIQQWL